MMNFKPLYAYTDNFIFYKSEDVYYINNIKLSEEQLIMFLEIHGYTVIPPNDRIESMYTFYTKCLHTLLEIEQFLPTESSQILFDSLVWFVTSDETAIVEAITKKKLRSYSDTYNN